MRSCGKTPYRFVRRAPDNHALTLIPCHIARIMGPTWGQHGSCRHQVCPYRPHKPCNQGCPGIVHRLYISGSFWHWLEITPSPITRFLCIVEWCRNALFWVTACPYMTHERRTCWWDDPHNARPPHGTSPTTKLTHRSLGDLDRILQM